MAYKPDVRELNANSVDVLNAIRATASPEYKAAVPVIENANTESIRAIGTTIMNYQALQNEFLNLLVNRIGRVILTSKMYDNPWSRFKKGMMEYGETIEEIFTNIAQPHQYDVETAVTNQYKREIPDVKSAFHYLNYQIFYKSTIQTRQLKQAFLSWDGVTQLISSIIDSMYTAANYDEFTMMKYMIARRALDGHMYPVNIPTITANNAKTIVSSIKGVSNQLEFMSEAYNEAHVTTYTPKTKQYAIVNATFDALIDVEVLASAFNMSKAEFMGNRILVDSFANLDTQRLGILLKGDATYTPFTSAEIALLKTIPVVIVSEDWFMIFDNTQEFTEKFNGEGLYWNYWLHAWKTFSASPFENAIVFTTSNTTVTSVSISPETVTATPDSSVSFSASVDSGFGNSNVLWSVSGNSSDDTTIKNGVLKIGADETATTLTVKVTSAEVSTVTATATVNVTT